MTKLADRPGRVISVGGGKVGAGESVLAANLAVALAQTGRKVALVELDLDAANQHHLLGVTRCRPGVRFLVDGSVADLCEALAPTAIPNLSVLGGTGAALGAAGIARDAKRDLLRKLRALESVVVLDVGGGDGYKALDHFLLGGQKLIVTTPRVTAIHDAYSFFKAAVLRLLHQQAEPWIEAGLLEPGLLGDDSARVPAILDRMHEQEPELADQIGTLLGSFNGYLVGNLVDAHTEAKVLPSVGKMMRDFLGIEIPTLGSVPSGSAVNDFVNDHRLFVLGRATEQTRALRQIVDALLADDVTEELDLELPLAEEPPEPVATESARHRPITLPGMTPFPRG
jgi:flagellar biosynthesis protein FlhG